MSNYYYIPNEQELKTLNGRKFVIFNHSFIPSGTVWRSYVTYVNDVMVTVTVYWDRVGKDKETILHKYDKEADAIVESIVLSGIDKK